jgi:hypothetical protein
MTETAPKTAKRTMVGKSRVQGPARGHEDKRRARGSPTENEMPRIEPPPRVEFDLEGSAQWLKRMDSRKAELLCTIEWSWSPVNERMESYYLQRGRTHWILWIKRYDDNWGKWEKPIAIARCPWRGLSDSKDAAMILLAAVLHHRHFCLPQSSSSSRRTASHAGFFDLSQSGERPER